MKIELRQKKVYIVTRLSAGCQRKAGSLSGQNPLCRNTDYFNMKKLVGTEKELQGKTSITTR